MTWLIYLLHLHFCVGLFLFFLSFKKKLYGCSLIGTLWTTVITHTAKKNAINMKTEDIADPIE